MVGLNGLDQQAKKAWTYRVALVDLLLHNEAIGCRGGHRVEVARYQHGDVCAMGNLLQPLQKRVHLPHRSKVTLGIVF